MPSLTIEQIVEVLNRHKHREREDWRIVPRYTVSGFSGNREIDRGEEPMVECGDFRLKGTVFVLRLTEAVIIAQYYLDREPGGDVERAQRIKAIADDVPYNLTVENELIDREEVLDIVIDKVIQLENEYLDGSLKGDFLENQLRKALDWWPFVKNPVQPLPVINANDGADQP